MASSPVIIQVATAGPAGPTGPGGATGPPGYAPRYFVQPGVPTSGVGLAGDMYINSTTSDVWGPKIDNTTWPATPACNIRGIAGYSPLYIVAAGAPSGATGNNGDMYINSTTADLYGPKSGGGWGGIVANLKGPTGTTGAQGPPGVAYTPRGAWSAATTYAQGDEATDASILYISLQAGNLNHAPAANPTWWQPVAAAGAQTPWLGNIDGATFILGNVGKVGIGTASPDSRLTATNNPIALPVPPAGTILHLGGADADNPRITLDAFGGIPNWTLRSAGGTAAAPTASAVGAVLGNLVVFGRGATGYSTGARAAVGVIAAENWTDSAQGTALTFSTSLIGAAVAGERMRIDGAGNVGINIVAPADKLTLVPVIYSANQNGGIRLQSPGGEWYYRIALKSDSGGGPRLAFDVSTIEIFAITGDGMGIGKVPLTGRVLDVAGDIWGGNYHGSSVIMTGKHNIFGTPAGSTAALSSSDANVCLYDNGSGNWAGIGADSGGVMWFRTGLAGSPDARMVIDTLGRVGIAKVSPAYALDVTGDVNCTGAFRVNGSPLTIDASQVASGVLATARLGTGTANSSVYLRGDGTWAAAAGGSQTPWAGDIDGASHALNNCVAVKGPAGTPLFGAASLSYATVSVGPATGCLAFGAATNSQITLYVRCPDGTVRIASLTLT